MTEFHPRSPRPAAVITGRWAAWWHDIAGSATGPIAIIVPANGSRPSWPDLTVLRRAWTARTG